MHINNIGDIIDWKTEVEWNSEKINNHAKNLAFKLSESQIDINSKIIILHDDSPRYVADLLGIWFHGSCGVCLNHNITQNELKKIIKMIKPKAIITSEKIFKFEIDPKYIIIYSEKIKSNFFVKFNSESNLDDDALILFTSGTTGIPKGVVHSFRSIFSRLILNQYFIPKEDRKMTLSILPTYFGHGLIGNILTPLLDGQKIVLAQGTSLDVQSNFANIVDKYKISFMSSVPSFWKKILLSSQKLKKNSLKRVQIGSAPLSIDLWSEVSEWCSLKNIFNMYGITETANWISGISLENEGLMDGSIGFPWGGTFAILDEKNNIQSSGVGELLIQNTSLMRGYYNLEDKTNEVLNNGWYHSGDVGILESNGSARLTGRIKYMINRGGLKVHPEDIDLVLEKNNEISEACTFSVPHSLEGETIGVAIQMKDKNNFNELKLKKWCSNFISREKIPTKWFLVDSIPKTDRGKINRDNVASFCLKVKETI